MNSIPNATPMPYQLGIKDNSGAVPPLPEVQKPTHMPLSYIYAAKGDTDYHVVGSDVTGLYGIESFDPIKAWATHSSEMALTHAKAGNAQMMKRVVPADAGPKANFLLSLDVGAVAALPTYERDSAGVIQLDEDGEAVVVDGVTVAGYKVKWVLTSITSGGPGTADSTTFGAATSATGDLTGVTGSSTRYPILQFYSGSYGSGGNNAGLRIMAPLSTDDAAVNATVMDGLKAYPFRLQAISRVSSAATPTVTNALTGDAAIEFVLKTGAINPQTGAKITLKDIFKDAYQVVGNPLRADTFADIPNVHVYQSHIDTLVTQFFAAEKAALEDLEEDEGADFAEDESAANKYLFNLLTFRNRGGAQYRSITQVLTGSNVVVLGASTNLFCAGGSDGTMSANGFNTLVRAELAKFADKNSEVQDEALYPLSIMYDSGFQMETKEAMCNLLMHRKDTAIVLSTYTIGDDLTHAEEASIALSLRNKLALFPESTYFGTPVVRGVVMARYGKLLTSAWPTDLPLTFWLAQRAGEMMGAGNGVWNAAKLFDSGGRTIVDTFSGLNVKFVPNSQRVLDWANGLNYPIPYSREQMFYPALKTAYNDDTSILTSFFAMMCCVDLQKVGVQVWRETTGDIRKTRAQLIKAVNQKVIDKTNGRYAGLFKIVPDAFISGGDAERGYSYTLPIKMYGNGAKTVMTLSVEANRMPDEA